MGSHQHIITYHWYEGWDPQLLGSFLSLVFFFPCAKGASLGRVGMFGHEGCNG